MPFCRQTVRHLKHLMQVSLLTVLLLKSILPVGHPVAQRPQETHCSELIRIFYGHGRQAGRGGFRPDRCWRKKYVQKPGQNGNESESSQSGKRAACRRTEKSVGVNQANDGNRAAEQYAEENGSKKIFGRTVLTIAGAASENSIRNSWNSPKGQRVEQ